MKNVTFRCDECGVEKKESNHWYEVSSDDSLPPGILIHQWDGGATLSKHICGQNCMQKVLDRWMTKGTL